MKTLLLLINQLVVYQSVVDIEQGIGDKGSQ
jgi:hypothetical protein